MRDMRKNVDAAIRRMTVRRVTAEGVRRDLCRDVERANAEGRLVLASRLEALLTNEAYLRLRLRRNYALQVADEAEVLLRTDYPETYELRT